MFILFSYFLLLILMGLFDFFWLGLIAKNIYSSYNTFTIKFYWQYIFIMYCYILHTAGLCWYVIKPAFLVSSDYKSVFLSGAFFGLIVYGVFNFTNNIIFNWPVQIILYDLSWGTFMSGAISVISYGITKKLWKY